MLDPNEMVVGSLFEDNVGLAILRRFLLGALLPQNYDLTIGEARVADLRQKFTFFGYVMNLDFTLDVNHLLDHRLGIAAAILLSIIEGKQQN